MELSRNHFQRNSSWNAPYTFSGKEKDVETGYGYVKKLRFFSSLAFGNEKQVFHYAHCLRRFGARYYDSGLSIWLSVDPMSDKYPSMSPYNYCANNPVILVDPDGREIGDFYDLWGERLGTDGNPDGMVYFVDDRESIRKINKNDRKNKTTDVSDVIVYMTTSINDLSDALEVFDRTKDNGGSKEEYTVWDNDGNGFSGQGTEDDCDMPTSSGRLSIHSHPFTENGDKLSTPDNPSRDDKNAFKNFDLNIIVGLSQRYELFINNHFSKWERDEKMTFYGKSDSGKPLMDLMLPVVRTIVNNYNNSKK
ncbi:MAG: hypothetical protein CVU04_00170 [Bacteroidetes bacterium HGW-Bacteroidetes-20]|nr:MAG: hypothetical protein CVU04_00170 [Bacteroidetes bacterium HGW-Bacteroidetes-20]